MAELPTGEWSNGSPNGKDQITTLDKDEKYLTEGNIITRVGSVTTGNFVDGPLESNVESIAVNGSYFVCQFNDGQLNGYGAEYDKNSNIIYEGQWVTNVFKGNNTTQ